METNEHLKAARDLLSEYLDEHPAPRPTVRLKEGKKKKRKKKTVQFDIRLTCRIK